MRAVRAQASLIVTLRGVWQRLRRRFSRARRVETASGERPSLAKSLIAVCRGLQKHAEGVWHYHRWVAKHTPNRAALNALAARVNALPLQPRISVLMPVYNTKPSWLRAAISSVIAQIYPNWELCIADDASTSPATLAVLAHYSSDPRIRIVYRTTNGHIAEASNDALRLATGQYIALLDHDDVLTPDALAEMVREINAHPNTDVLYSDEDKLTPWGRRCDPFFKPDWSPEHFVGQMYTCHLTVARTALVREAGGFRDGFEGAQDYDLWLRMVARTSRVRHVPKILYHWRKVPGSAAAEPEAKPYAIDSASRALHNYARLAGLDAFVEPGLALGLWRVRRRLKDRPEITIIIPTHTGSGEQNDRLAKCLQSIVRNTTWPDYRLLVVDDGSPGTAHPALETFPHQRVSAPARDGVVSLAHKLNVAIAQATTEYLVVCYDDIEIATAEWLEALLEFAQEPEIGVVGCKLRFPDGRLHHVGVATGVEGIAAHLFQHASADSGGWNAGAYTVRNYSAVSGALMMTRRQLWQAVDGFDERLRHDFIDVDFCLKVREAGYRIVFTPYAEAYRHLLLDPATSPDPADAVEMRRKWGKTLARDGFYNPNLTRRFNDCRLSE